MRTFEYVGAPCRVLFGNGILKQEVRPLLEKLNSKAAIVLSTPEQVSVAETVRSLLGGAAVCVFSEATMHTPTHITEKALALIKKKNVDGIVSVGGGSTIGLGKAVSVRMGLPHLCIPTTYAGSEMTPILGETENGQKATRRDTKILPNAVLYDVELSKMLPTKISLNPIIELMALEGIKALCEAFPIINTDPQNLEARYTALYGAWLCGLVLGSVDMAVHHKLCHALGGTFNLPHAETHVVMLPHTVSYNQPHVPEAMEKLASVLPESNGDAVQGLNALNRRLGINFGLKDLGMPEHGVEKAAEIAISNPYKNPRTLERQAIQEIIRRAWAGENASPVW
ncbi:hypothetical protein B0J13DRAFT_665298 [Dactylonectria estremocensis]|uniref:Maleylacetate reductase n=1 Tax=Dactylonectria estremocensis TaxID=1079267 RepID=A0A9P9J7A2_9HYPO|nr:hypothetical protein B0J13DRAFT_665298 [Dactylonectria estremocensis]